MGTQKQEEGEWPSRQKLKARNELYSRNTALGKAYMGVVILLPALRSLLFANKRRLDLWQ